MVQIYQEGLDHFINCDLRDLFGLDLAEQVREYPIDRLKTINKRNRVHHLDLLVIRLGLNRISSHFGGRLLVLLLSSDRLQDCIGAVVCRQLLGLHLLLLHVLLTVHIACRVAFDVIAIRILVISRGHRFHVALVGVAFGAHRLMLEWLSRDLASCAVS